MPTYPYNVPLVNGNFETGTATGWTLSFGNGPAILSGGPVGSSFYARGGSQARCAWHQDVTLDADLHADIDAGLLTIKAQCDGCTYSDDSDSANVIVECRDASNNWLASIWTGYTNWPATWALRETGEIPVPVGTRIVRIGTRTLRSSGTNNDGYYDNFAVILNARSDGNRCLPVIVDNCSSSTVSLWTKVSGGGTLVYGGALHWGTAGFKANDAGGVWRRDFPIDPSAWSDVDAGTQTVEGHYYVQQYPSDNDNFEMLIDFLDGSNAVIGNAHTRTSTEPSQEGSRYTIASVAVPPGTRSLRATYTHIKDVGSNSDAHLLDLNVSMIGPGGGAPPAGRRRHAALLM